MQNQQIIEDKTISHNRVSDYSVSVEFSGKKAWQRSIENGQSGGYTARSKTLLENVVVVLCDALAQAESELSLFFDHNNRISNGRFITLSDIKRDRKHDVALGVAGDADSVSVVKIFSCVDELHNVIVVVRSDGN